MYNNQKIIAIIPARGGSRGIPKKNIKSLCGKPLIGWTIEQAKESKFVDEIFVSTDSDEIANISREFGAKIIIRPDNLSGDTCSTESALLHASETIEDDYDLMVLLQCTSPIRFSDQIDKAIEQIFDENADSLLSGYINDSFLWLNGKSVNYDFKNRPRRQDKEWEFVENGSFYIFKKKILLDEKNRLGGKISQFIMPKWMSFEIDEPFDLELIEFLMKEKYINNSKKIKKDIKMILFDVDGIFTDGGVYLNNDGDEILKFSRIDGKGIELIRNQGIVLGVISSENSTIVKKRMEKLLIEEIHLGIKNKLDLYEKLKEKYNLRDDEIGFCGDDIQDIPILKKVGFSCCPKNALEDVKKVCIYNSKKSGGQGFVREICNMFLK